MTVLERIERLGASLHHRYCLAWDGEPSDNPDLDIGRAVIAGLVPGHCSGRCADGNGPEGRGGACPFLTCGDNGGLIHRACGLDLMIDREPGPHCPASRQPKPCFTVLHSSVVVRCPHCNKASAADSWGAETIACPACGITGQMKREGAK